MANNKDFAVIGDFWVDTFSSFGSWFNGDFRAKFKNLFPKALNTSGYEEVMRNIYSITGKRQLTLGEFVGIFCVMYNETNFACISEIGGQSYIESAGSNKVAYAYKERGRGLIQITGKGNYDAIFKELNMKNFDAHTSEELDEIFSTGKVCYPATRIWLTSSQLGKRGFDALLRNDFRTFGGVISGDYNTYGMLFKSRCDALYNALLNAKLTASTFLQYRRRIIYGVLGVAVLGIGGYFGYQYWKKLK